MTEPDSLLARVAALERMAQDYSEKVGAADRLSLGVERLADETGGLNAVLHKVDEQQQRLSTLGRDLERVREGKADKDDLDRKAAVLAAEVESFRSRVVRRGVTTSVAIVLVLLVGAVGLAAYERRQDVRTVEICRERNVGAQLIKAYVDEQIAIAEDNQDLAPDIRSRQIESLGNLRDKSPIVDCNEDGVRE